MSNTIEAPHYRAGFRAIMSSFIHLSFDFNVIGIENLIEPPFLLTSNHLHHADTPAFATAMPFEMYGVGAKKIQHTWLGKIFSLGSVVWVEQTEAEMQTIKQMMKVVKAGHTLALYPEGHRAKRPGMLQAKEGTAFIANRRDVPIVPAAITGTHLFMKKVRPKVTLTVGKPFKLPSHRAKDEELKFYTEYLMCAIASMLPEDYHGFYAGNPLIERVRSHGTGLIDTLIEQGDFTTYSG
ncbi:MAG: lysophospholipid acyltransferase family protein [Chloroflexota bacterium]